MRFKLFGQIFTINPVWLIITLTAFLILIKLSHWQWQRAAEKTAQLSRLAQIQQQGPISGHALLQQTAEQWDGVLLQDTAQWLAPYIWLLDNQILDGKVGYNVIIPVQFASSSSVALVNLGWVKGDSDRRLLPELTIPVQLQLQALVRSRPANTLLLGQNSEGDGYPMRIQQVNYQSIEQLLPHPLYPAILYQQTPSQFIPHYQAVVMPPEKHRGYALQWFGLAIAVLFVGGAASWTREIQNEQK